MFAVRGDMVHMKDEKVSRNCVVQFRVEGKLIESISTELAKEMRHALFGTDDVGFIIILLDHNWVGNICIIRYPFWVICASLPRFKHFAAKNADIAIFLVLCVPFQYHVFSFWIQRMTNCNIFVRYDVV